MMRKIISALTIFVKKIIQKSEGLYGITIYLTDIYFRY